MMLLSISLVAFSQENDSTNAVGDWLSGDLELGLIAGRSERDSDVEIEQLLRLKVDPLKHERIHLRTTLWTSQDLDGRESSTSVFRGLNDTSDSWVNTRLLQLYMEVDGDKDDSRLRVGRQRITKGVAYNRIDGAYLHFDRNRWSYYGFVGARASVYESSHDDLSTGGGLSWRPLPTTRVALDFFYGDDQRRQFTPGDVEASLTSLTVRHALNAYHSLFGRATWHESDLDEFRLTAQGFFQEDGLFYTAAFRKRISTLDERPTDFPQFYHVVGELNGYEDLSGVLTFPLSDRFELGVEAQIHDAEGNVLGTGNRDYGRYALSLNANDLAERYDARVIVEFWDADGGQSEKTVSGEVSRNWSRTRASVGVDYDLFQDQILQFDPLGSDDFYVESKEDIYALYFKIAHDLNEQQSLQCRASVEDDDSSDAPYWRIRAYYKIKF